MSLEAQPQCPRRVWRVLQYCSYCTLLPQWRLYHGDQTPTIWEKHYISQNAARYTWPACAVSLQPLTSFCSYSIVPLCILVRIMTSTSIFPCGGSAEKRNMADSSPILDFSIILFNARSFLPTVTQTLWPRFGKTWSWLKENIIVKINRISWDYIYSDHGYYFPSNAEVRNMADTDSSPFSTMFKTRTFLPPVTHTLWPKIGKKLSWLK